MDCALPATHGLWDRFFVRACQVAPFAPDLARVAALHDDVYRTANANEERGQTRQTPRAVTKHRLVVVNGVRHNM